jgi:hypothetical protein
MQALLSPKKTIMTGCYGIQLPLEIQTQFKVSILVHKSDFVEYVHGQNPP